METREQNLSKILLYLKEQNIRFKLIDGIFKYNPDTVEDDALRDAIEECRPGLTYILRLQSGICTDCGKEPITRPQMRGQERKWCETCYFARVTPIMERLMQSDQSAKRSVKIKPADADDETEEDELCPSLDLE